MSDFDKISAPSLKETCVQAILTKILSGDLKPGDKLPAERDLAEAMGVSRSSLNHGIVELEAMGFLTVEPRRGTVVNDYRRYPTPQSLAAVMRYSSVEMDQALFADLMATRVLIESECARLACRHIYESSLEKMQRMVDQLAAEPADPTEILYQFHYQLIQASGNTIYSMIYRGFETLLRNLIRQHYNMRAEDIRESARLHQQLLDAIAGKDEDGAEDVARRILTQGSRALEEKYGYEG